MKPRVNRQGEAELVTGGVNAIHQVTTEADAREIGVHRDRLDDYGLDRLSALRLQHVRNCKQVSDEVLALLREYDQLGPQECTNRGVLFQEFVNRNGRVEEVVREAQPR